MGQLRLAGVRKHYGSQEVIRGVDLSVEDGEFLVFVGPSGCGKSTLLRMIAGLESIDAGDLFIDGVRANDVRAAERGVAMVFQSYALYPHMTVAENMGFALRMAGVARKEREARVQRAAEVLRITELLDRRPAELSGGQRQRVAIGRAIVRKPKVFLFDEPLSNLDAALRVTMRIELARLHRELGTTMIYVTHDQVEAMTLGHRIAVFQGGTIEQLGAPLELYRHPANTFVAGFLGTPSINFIAAPAADASSAHRELWAAAKVSAAATRLGLRPEHLQVARTGDGVAARIVLVEHMGDAAVLHLKLEGLEATLQAKLAAPTTDWQTGETAVLGCDPAHALAFGADGRRLT
jgi:multiple sugar transport system ATP-binding protein